MRYNLEEIGFIVKLLRKNKKITQMQLANMVGVDQATVSRVEKGNQYITMVVYNKILMGLNISLNEEYYFGFNGLFNQLYNAFEENNEKVIDSIISTIKKCKLIYYNEFPIYKLTLTLSYYVKSDLDSFCSIIKEIIPLKSFYKDIYKMRYNQIIGLYNVSINNYDNALTFFNDAYKYISEKNILDGLFYYQTAWLHFLLGNHTTSILSLDKSRLIFKSKKNNIRLIYIHNLFGQIHMNDGNYDVAEKIFLACFNSEAYLKSNDGNYYIIIRNLGLTNFFNNNYDEAIYYLEMLYKDKKYHNQIVIFFLLFALKNKNYKDKYEKYIKECKDMSNLDPLIDKNISILEENIIYNLYNNNFINDLEIVIEKYNLYNFTYWMINNLSEEIYNTKKYSTYKNMFDVFINLRLRCKV